MWSNNSYHASAQALSTSNTGRVSKYVKLFYKQILLLDCVDTNRDFILKLQQLQKLNFQLIRRGGKIRDNLEGN